MVSEKKSRYYCEILGIFFLWGKNSVLDLIFLCFFQILHHKGCSLFLEQKMMMKNTFLMISLLSLMKFVGVKERMLSGGRQQGKFFVVFFFFKLSAAVGILRNNFKAVASSGTDFGCRA